MHIDINFKNIDSSDALKDYAKKKLAKIARFIDRPSEAHVILSVQKIRHKAEVTLNADGMIFNAIEITEDLYSAIDMVMDKIEKQVKKHKEKLKVRKTPVKAIEAVPEAKPKKRVKVVREKDYFLKPMNVEEAILHFDVVEEDFIIFHNTDSKQINLIYKMKDGAIGVV